MKVRVPASAANLGPGFDVLAIALSKYIEVELSPAKSLEIHATGEGSDFPADESHLAARVARKILGHSNVLVSISSEIPLARGLGSSAALALAVAAACGAKDPLAEAIYFDGHGENAAASFYGGLVAAVKSDDKVAVRQFNLDERLGFVLLIPNKQLTTADARSVLPELITRQDAIFNLGRMALLLSGLADADKLITQAGQDRIHQNYRAQLFPEAEEIMTKLTEAGAIMSCWSGAGSAILGICASGKVQSVRDSGDLILASVGLEGKSEALSADHRGLIVLEP